MKYLIYTALLINFALFISLFVSSLFNRENKTINTVIIVTVSSLFLLNIINLTSFTYKLKNNLNIIGSSIFYVLFLFLLIKLNKIKTNKAQFKKAFSVWSLFFLITALNIFLKLLIPNYIRLIFNIFALLASLFLSIYILKKSHEKSIKFLSCLSLWIINAFFIVDLIIKFTKLNFHTITELCSTLVIIPFAYFFFKEILKNQTQLHDKLDELNSIRSRLSEDLLVKTEELQSFLTVSNQIGSNYDFNDVLNKTIDFMLETFNYDTISILLVDEQKKYLSTYKFLSKTMPQKTIDKLSKIKIPISTKGGVSAYVAMSGFPIQIKDFDTLEYEIDNRYDKIGIKYINPKSNILVPIKFSNKVIGVLQMHNTTQKISLGEDEIFKIYAICSIIGSAIQNSQFFEKIQNSSTIIEEKNSELEQMIEEKNKLIGIVAHDLRTPLAIIQGLTFVLKNESKELITDEYANLFDDILGSVARMIALIDELLDYSSVMNGDINIKSEEVDLNEYLINVYKLNKILTEEKGIKLILNIEDKLPKVKIDKNKISQVIENLLSNAVKFSKEGTIILINAFTQNGLVKVNISDQGPGIREEYLETLFEYFKKTDNKPTKGEKSTGLGLAICKRILDLHEGEIGVNSKPGKGSTFYFSLPVSE